MASLGSVEQATLTANSDVNSLTQGANTTLSGVDVDGYTTGFAGFGSSGGALANDFVGLNAGGIDTMCAAVDTYCNEVNDWLNQIQTVTNPDGAFAGQYKAEIIAFVNSVKNSCLSMVNGMQAFKKDLQAVGAAMSAKDTSVAGSLSGDASSINKAAGSESN